MGKEYGAVCCVPVNKDGYWEIRARDTGSGEERTAAYIDSFTGRVLYVDDGARTDTDIQAAVRDKVRDVKRKHPLGMEELEKSYKDVLLFMLAQSRQESEFIIYPQKTPASTGGGMNAALRTPRQAGTPGFIRPGLTEQAFGMNARLCYNKYIRHNAPARRPYVPYLQHRYT